MSTSVEATVQVIFCMRIKIYDATTLVGPFYLMAHFSWLQPYVQFTKLKKCENILLGYIWQRLFYFSAYHEMTSYNIFESMFLMIYFSTVVY